MYLLVFIVFHELGHIVCFKYFGKKIDSVGFKFNYIFPSFFVRMNDTYLLSKKEKIIVHLGGLLFSLGGIVMKNNKTLQRETKSVINDMNFDKVLSKRNELDNVNDLWYFAKSAKNRWIAGSAH